MDRRDFLRAAGTAGVATLFGTGVSAAREAEFTREEHAVESFDGVEIPTVLFVPEGGADATLMATHGWGGSKESVERYPSLAADNGYALVGTSAASASRPPRSGSRGPGRWPTCRRSSTS